MQNKLAFRNAKRSVRDYMIYLITMTGIAALMFAFNTMVFSSYVQKMCGDIQMMAIMIGLATFFIVLIVAWLINYMVHFMLERRSREFGTYLLLGMKKKQISRLYMRENFWLGILAFFIGFVLGMFLQQVLMSVFYHVFEDEYHISIEFSAGCLIMTASCYFGSYLLALLRNKRIFKRMSISDFMRMERENEKVKEGREGIRQWLFFAAVIYFLVFDILLMRGNYKALPVILLTIGFLAAIYVFYIGFASFVVCYIRKGGQGIYKGSNLFLFRQLSSKLKTMRFTMGTLTILISCALLGGTIAMMFVKFQEQAIMSAVPFDVMVFSIDPKDDFVEERSLLAEKEQIGDEVIYRIYEDGTHKVNDYLYTHTANLGSKFCNEDGTLNEQKVKDEDWGVYYEYDTYIRLSDYNKLREMLGYDKISLDDGAYAIHTKDRMEEDFRSDFFSKPLQAGTTVLTLSGIYTEVFSQNGLNGADYLLVVPDDVCEAMEPYYSLLAVSLLTEPGADLQSQLEAVYMEKHQMMEESEFYAAVDQGELPEDAEWESSMSGGGGSDQILTMGGYDVMVREIVADQMRGIISALTFPLSYIALVFLCVAMTILAVQQLSDSNRYRYRYDVLRKLGMGQKELNRIVFKQLLIYYMVPVAVAIILSAVIAVFAGNRFVFYTGAADTGFSYFGISLLVFGGVYVLYFVATYLGFLKNIEEGRH